MLLNAPSARAQASAGSITAITGDVRITRAGRSFAATYSAPVQVGDRIFTGSNGRTTITLSDNTQLELTEFSAIVLTENMLNPNGARAKTSMSLLGGMVR